MGYSKRKPPAIKHSLKASATEAQLKRLVEQLRHGSRHTHELRRVGIPHPAGRVQNLIKRGYDISSSRITTVDSGGFSHAGVALYSLIAKPGRR